MARLMASAPPVPKWYRPINHRTKKPVYPVKPKGWPEYVHRCLAAMCVEAFSSELDDDEHTDRLLYHWQLDNTDSIFLPPSEDDRKSMSIEINSYLAGLTKYREYLAYYNDEQEAHRVYSWPSEYANNVVSKYHA